jgi:hypothetical protein
MADTCSVVKYNPKTRQRGPCGRAVWARGMCEADYRRVLRAEKSGAKPRLGSVVIEADSKKRVRVTVPIMATAFKTLGALAARQGRRLTHVSAELLERALADGEGKGKP